MRDMKAKSIVGAIVWTEPLTANLAAADPSATNPSFNPPAGRSPSALTADAADRQALVPGGTEPVI
jgi:hypothetical protein